MVSDNSMRELVCAVFEQAYKDAKYINKKSSVSFEQQRLQRILDFLNDEKSYWWACLRTFCESVDEEALKDKIRKELLKTYNMLAEKPSGAYGKRDNRGN